MVIKFVQTFIGLAVVGIFGATILHRDIGWHWILLAAAGAALVITAAQHGIRALSRHTAARRDKQRLWK